MSIVKINQRGNINIPREAINSFLTFEKGREFRVMTKEGYERSTKPKFKGATAIPAHDVSRFIF